MDSDEFLWLIVLAIMLYLCAASCRPVDMDYPHSDVPWTEQPY